MIPRLLLGDCLDILPELTPGSVGMVLVDMPYGNSAHRWDSPIDLDRWWALLKPVLRSGAAVIAHAQGLGRHAIAARRIYGGE